MKAMFALLTLFVSASAFAQPIACKQAMDQKLRKYVGAKNTLTYQTMQITKVGDEQLVEVTSLVLADNPSSETLQAYYWMVSATCLAKEGTTDTSNIANLVLSNDMPGEGGVTAKIVTKLRY